MKRIHLFVRSGQWLAQTYGPEADVLRSIFGTTTLPTPFLAAMEPEQVRRRVQALNPDSLVILCQGHQGDGSHICYWESNDEASGRVVC